MTPQTEPAKSKIAFVTTMAGVPWGGSEELWSQTAARLKELGHPVSASVLKWPETPAPLKQLVHAGVEIAFRRRTETLTRRVVDAVRRRISSHGKNCSAMDWLRKTQPAFVVISQGGPWDGVEWMLICDSLGIGYCTIVQANSEIWWPPDTRLSGIRKAYANARRVFFVSKANWSLIEKQCGMPIRHAEVLNNPLKIRQDDSIGWPGEANGINLACVGRLDPRAKGQDVIFEVMAMPKWRQREVRVNIYGSGFGEASLRSLREFFGLKQVAFHGQVSNIAEIWRRNHALLLPSRYEGLPLVVFESLLAGRIAIVTNVGGNTEVVHDGVNGFVADAPTPTSLDDALERAWRKRGEWREMGELARREVMRTVPRDPVGIFAEKLTALMPALR